MPPKGKTNKNKDNEKDNKTDNKRGSVSGFDDSQATPKIIKISEMTKEQKVSIHNNSWVGKWGHLTQSKLLRVPNSLGAPFFVGGTWKVG